MTSLGRERRSRHIVAVFGDGADASVATLLESLVSAAPVDVHGVFVEDHALFQLAELPFAAEVCRVTTVRRPLQPRDLERQMKVLAATAERAVRRVAERTGSPWTFQKHRGRLSTALAGLADVDLLIVGATRSVLAPAGELLATASAVRSREAEALRPVVALVDPSTAPHGAVDVAVELAGRTNRRLVIFVPPAADTTERGFVDSLARLDAGSTTVRSVPTEDSMALLSAVRRSTPAAVVVSAGTSAFDEARVGSLRRALRCPIVVVRERTRPQR